MTHHVPARHMLPTAINEDDDMAKAFTPDSAARVRQEIRAGLSGNPAKKIVARAVPHGGPEEGLWRAEFAVPGQIPDFTRTPAGEPLFYESKSDAVSAAMAAAIFTFNAPRESLKRHGGSHYRENRGETVRPSKMSAVEMEMAMRAAGLDVGDLVFLLDKRSNRIRDWLGGADIPHEVRLLLETWAAFEGTADFAFDRTNAAIDAAE